MFGNFSKADRRKIARNTRLQHKQPIVQPQLRRRREPQTRSIFEGAFIEWDTDGVSFPYGTSWTSTARAVDPTVVKSQPWLDISQSQIDLTATNGEYLIICDVVLSLANCDESTTTVDGTDFYMAESSDLEVRLKYTNATKDNSYTYQTGVGTQITIDGSGSVNRLETVTIIDHVQHDGSGADLVVEVEGKSVPFNLAAGGGLHQPTQTTFIIQKLPTSGTPRAFSSGFAPSSFGI